MLNFFFDVINLIVIDVIIGSIKQVFRGTKWIFKSIRNQLNRL